MKEKWKLLFYFNDIDNMAKLRIKYFEKVLIQKMVL